MAWRERRAQSFFGLGRIRMPQCARAIVQAENRLHGLSEFLWNVNASLEAAVPSPRVLVLQHFDVKRFTEIAASPLAHNTLPGRGGFAILESLLPSKLLHRSQAMGRCH